ncbi:MAG: hypothetical protein RL274_1926 [Pseudomonadota bacterium]|jgi:hypothetical protein
MNFGSLRGKNMRKLIIAMAAGVALTPSVALADAREDVITGVTRCAALTDDRQWLDCYYGAAQPLRAQLGLSPAPQAQIRLLEVQPKAAALPATVTRAAVRTGPPPMPRRSIFNVWGGDDVINNAPIKSFDMSGGAFVITLNDGQVWEQTEDDAIKRPVRWRQPASAMRVTISQGAMGTFNLVMGDENTLHKVKRVR